MRFFKISAGGGKFPAGFLKVFCRHRKMSQKKFFECFSGNPGIPESGGRSLHGSGKQMLREKHLGFELFIENGVGERPDPAGDDTGRSWRPWRLRTRRPAQT